MTDGSNGPGAVVLGAADRSAAVADVKAALRITSSEEDALIAVQVEAALGLAEGFLGQVTLARTMTLTIEAGRDWRMLPAGPIATISGVSDANGTPLDPAAYAIDIDATGDGWVRLSDGACSRLTVEATAGIAVDWASLPAAIRQGVTLLAAHLHDAGASGGAPPAAVTALWRPFRALRLGGERRRA